jgi:hypothetical protein
MNIIDTRAVKYDELIHIMYVLYLLISPFKLFLNFIYCIILGFAVGRVCGIFLTYVRTPRHVECSTGRHGRTYYHSTFVNMGINDTQIKTSKEKNDEQNEKVDYYHKFDKQLDK